MEPKKPPSLRSAFLVASVTLNEDSHDTGPHKTPRYTIEKEFFFFHISRSGDAKRGKGGKKKAEG
mgnify:CR=1 FL=1